MTIPEAPPRTALTRHREAAARLPYRRVDDLFAKPVDLAALNATLVQVAHQRPRAP